MMLQTRLGRIVTYCIVSLIVMVTTAANDVTAQVPPTTQASLPYHSKNQTLGTVTCASSLCHGSVKLWKESNVLQNEYLTWSRMDKHARAYSVLLNDRSQRIAKNLNLSQPSHEAKICLDCHAHVVPENKRGERFVMTDGITCESCHGPAEKWIKTHVEPVPAGVSQASQHAKNIADGMFPTSDATSRASLCMSCHFGNQDKFVNHRMMAAGHPRLSFELDTFTELAPKHFIIDQDYAARKQVWDGAKTWGVGQALAVAETMRMLQDPKHGRDGLFPELVLFDCHACHHPMAENRWQPKTALGGRVAPGLVRLNDSSMLMLRAIATVIDPKLGAAVSAQTQKLHRAIAGETKGVADPMTEAANLQSLAINASRIIADTNFSSATMIEVLHRLIDDGALNGYSDFAAAEQATLSIGSIGAFLAKRGALTQPQEFNKQLRKLNIALKNDEQFKPKEFALLLKSLKTTTTNKTSEPIKSAHAGAKP